MTFIKRILGAGLLLALSLGAQAQVWPGQTIKIIVPFTPGTGMDTIARAVSPKLPNGSGSPSSCKTPPAPAVILARMRSPRPRQTATPC